MRFLAFAWVMSSFGYWANPDKTVYPESQIGVVKNVFVGKLTCSARLLNIDTVQMWCLKNNIVVINQLASLKSSSVVTFDYYDNKPNEVDALITWMCAYVEDNPKTVAYQVAYSTDAQKTQKMLTGQF